ncbi:DUF7287 family protein [Halostella litorea]|uniref:DUF7287 family protein n=1 Tax=Halostella litorea TaxID=2528831 RepID=UPI001091EB06|nr:hypothetical protein [Halostella litorea]
MRLGGRGQTTQDFAVGISIFLLTTAFLFAFIPTIFTPFDSDTGGSDESRADRIAATVVEDFSVDGKPGTLDPVATRSFFDAGGDGDDLREQYKLPTTARVNVTVRTQNGSVIREIGSTRLKRGDAYDDQVSASSSRVISFDDPSSDVCTPTCRLVVRVW